jgi:hypothetical protein
MAKSVTRQDKSYRQHQKAVLTILLWFQNNFPGQHAALVNRAGFL